MNNKTRKTILAVLIIVVILVVVLILITNRLGKKAEKNAKYAVGNYITFGTYPQTADGTDNTPIEWLVLDRDGDKALLISRYGLDSHSHKSDLYYRDWEQTSLRKWLNEDFLNTAFTSEQQERILLTTVDNSRSQGYGGWDTDSQRDFKLNYTETRDKVFLLSCAEAYKYFGVTYEDTENVKARVAPTEFAAAHRAWVSDDFQTESGEAAGSWWLRSPSENQLCAACVDKGGSLTDFYLDSVNITVRPAIWITMDD